MMCEDRLDALEAYPTPVVASLFPERHGFPLASPVLPSSCRKSMVLAVAVVTVFAKGDRPCESGFSAVEVIHRV